MSQIGELISWRGAWTPVDLGSAAALDADRSRRATDAHNLQQVAQPKKGEPAPAPEPAPKRTNWELGTRVPLIMRVPWLEPSVGRRSRALVETWVSSPRMVRVGSL